MCGLILLLSPDEFDDPRKALWRGMSAMSHRGLPEHSGTYHGGAYVGHVRLPIRGLGHEYDQPFELSPGRVGAFVGEVFTAPGKNDAIWACRRVKNGGYGLDGQDGFWCIVDHDDQSRTTRVWMDHLAIKPLYWHTERGVIASELRGIRAAVEELDIDEHYLSNVLKWGYDPSSHTPYKNVRRLERGCVYTFRGGRLDDVSRYFPLRERDPANLRHEIEQAVKNRLVSDVPVAVLCSGGLDSTIVALLAAQAGQPLTVFHVDNEEAEFVRMIRWPDNVELKELKLEEGVLGAALDATEEPVDLGSVLPQYQLGRAVQAAGYSVALSGDGADELFGGYRRAKEYDSQQSDIFSELVHYHLPRLDKTMMASTVELRSPFLAPRVVECALGVPYEQRTEKQLLKRLFSDIVPKAILEREKKPLKTAAVRTGGVEYRKMVIDKFRERNR